MNPVSNRGRGMGFIKYPERLTMLLINRDDMDVLRPCSITNGMNPVSDDGSMDLAYKVKIKKKKG